jgi:hypothetical protein
MWNDGEGMSLALFFCGLLAVVTLALLAVFYIVVHYEVHKEEDDG